MDGLYDFPVAVTCCSRHGFEVSCRRCRPSELLQQSLDLCVLELNDLLLPLIHHAAEGGQQDVPGLGQVWICSAPNIISFCGSRMKSSG
jgi:hypothetical protein